MTDFIKEPTATIAVSDKGFKRKPRRYVVEDKVINEFSGVVYNVAEYTPSELITFITDGHILSHDLSEGKGWFRKVGRCEGKVVKADIAFIDVDHSQYQSIQDVYDKLCVKPTFMYYSFSSIEGNIRYRVGYYLNETITSPDKYRQVVYALAKTFSDETGEIVDTCSRSIYQFMFGTNNSDTLTSNTVIDVTSLNLPPIEEEPLKTQKKAAKSKDKPKIATTYGLDGEVIKMIDSFFILKDRKRWLEKYGTCCYVTRVEKDNWLYTEENNYVLQFTDKDFIELKGYKKRISDGNNRKNKLFTRSIIRRFIKKDISIKDFAYSLLMDIHYWFEIGQGLDENWCKYTISKIMSMTVEEIYNRYKDVIDRSIKNSFRKSGYIFAPGQFKPTKEGQLCNTSKLNHARRVVTKEMITSYLNEGLSVKDIMKTTNLSSTTVYRYKKEWDSNSHPLYIKANNTICNEREKESRLKELLKDCPSRRKARELLNGQGIKIGEKKLREILKEIKNNKENEVNCNTKQEINTNVSMTLNTNVDIYAEAAVRDLTKEELLRFDYTRKNPYTSNDGLPYINYCSNIIEAKRMAQLG